MHKLRVLLIAAKKAAIVRLKQRILEHTVHLHHTVLHSQNQQKLSRWMTRTSAGEPCILQAMPLVTGAQTSHSTPVGHIQTSKKTAAPAPQQLARRLKGHPRRKWRGSVGFVVGLLECAANAAVGVEEPACRDLVSACESRITKDSDGCNQCCNCLQSVVECKV